MRHAILTKKFERIPPMNGFKVLMVATFVAAFATMFAGVINMGNKDEDGTAKKSSGLMFARVFFSFALFAEIVIYLFFIR